MRRHDTRRLTIGTALAALLLLPGPATSAPPMTSPPQLAVTDASAEIAATGKAIEGGQYEQSIDTLNRLIDTGTLSKQNLAIAYHHRGIAHQKLGLQNSALDDYTKAIDLGTLPKNLAARACYNRGIALAATGDTFSAERDYSKSIDLAPDYAAAYHNRANLERERKDYPTAIRDYGAAIDRLNDDKRKLPLFGRALAYEKSGNLAAAVADLNQALAVDPAYAPARAKLRELGPQLAAMPQTPDDRNSGNVIKVASAGGWDTTAVRSGRADAPAPIRQEAVQAAVAPETPAVPPSPAKIASLESGREAGAGATTGGHYRMQLGAFRKPESAAKAWANMQHRDAVLTGLDHSVETADLGAKGTYYRLQAGGFKTASEAKARCADLTAKKIVCVVVAR